MQFHPTAVVGANGADGLLVTEAIRGEGAQLLDAAGNRFVDELAPRDEVARAMQSLMIRTGAPSVDLDMRRVDPAMFPNVVSALREAGIDPEHELVPVAPAAHYMMGGIATDLDGRSTLPGLYAVGECSCTGLHGANRLASNSLTECFVFGARAGRAAAAEADSAPRRRPIYPSPASRRPAPAPASREALWRCAGLERDRDGLSVADARPSPARPADRHLRAGPHREPRRAPAARLPRARPRLDGHHVTIDRAGRRRARSLDLTSN